MPQKKYGILYTGNFEGHYDLNKDLYDNISKKFKFFYAIDLTALSGSRNQTNYIKNKFPNNFVSIKINNFNELNKFFFNKRFICINALPIKDFKTFKLNFYLKKYNIFHILNLRTGLHLPEYQFKKTITHSLALFLIGDLKHYVWRMLSIFGLSYKIDIFFLGQSQIKANFEKGFSKSVDNFFKTNIFSQYKKIVEVNNRISDVYNNLKNDISEKYVVCIDTPFDHPDRIAREESFNIKDKKRYYKKLNIYLLKLSRVFKRKVIICLHPKDVYWKKNFPTFKCTKFKSLFYIAKASVVVATASSLVGESVFFKKKTIVINSSLLGNYYNSRSERLSRMYNLSYQNIDSVENLQFNKKKILLDLTKRKEKYNYFLKKKYVMNKKINGTTQIINFLKKLN